METNISADRPFVDVIIPNYNGEKIIIACLRSLERTNYPNYRVILVDDCSTDRSVKVIENEFKNIVIVRNKKNLGFTGACNRGVKHALNDESKYVCLLNNDTVVDPNWLTALVETAEKGNAVAVQSKVRSLKNKKQFDYAGAAGGLIDVFGYPFAFGRVFTNVEKDHGQYDNENEIFYATGCAALFKKSAFKEVGFFDEDFFMYMEEIDLCWRLLLRDYKILSSPKSIIYHYGSYTIGENYLKKYLNHRNSLIMLLKNYSFLNLLWIYPIRLLFEFLTIFYCWNKNDSDRFKAILNSQIWIFQHFGDIMKKRRAVQRTRRISDRQIFKKMYRGSILIQYFILNRKKVSSFYPLK